MMAPARLTVQMYLVAHPRRAVGASGGRPFRERSTPVRRLIRRLGVYLLALWAAVTINFFLPRLAPGNPAEVVYSRLAQYGPVSPATLAALEAEFGYHPNVPLWVQYLQYLNNL